MAGSIWTPALPASLTLGLAASQGAALTATVTQNAVDTATPLAYLQGKMAFTSAGTAANALVVALTILASLSSTTVGLPVGDFQYITAGGTRYVGNVVLASQTTLNFVVNAATGLFGVNPAITVAAGDVLTFNLTVPLGP